MYSFINNNVAPASTAHTSQQLYDALLSRLHTFCGAKLPTTHEVTKIAKLLEYKNSFGANFRNDTSQNQGALIVIFIY